MIDIQLFDFWIFSENVSSCGIFSAKMKETTGIPLISVFSPGIVTGNRLSKFLN